ncbi:MAG: RnfA-Nqr electron transport subunit [Candidatus Aureabacteria bacterium]|nr:RnfA-Nqr electron transport subunit [Candidatus Auribacterota bacterium]
MDLIGLFLLAFNATLINNYVLHYFVGICAYIGVSKRIEMAFGMGCAVTFVMGVAAMLSWSAIYFLLQPGAPLTSFIFKTIHPGSDSVVNLSVLNSIVSIFVIASSVQLVEMYIRKFFPALYKAFGVYLPLITTNCAILFACIEIMKHVGKNAVEPWGLDKALLLAISAGMGFTLAIVLMAGIREDLENADVPAPLQGPGITLITAGIFAMAFMGFTGIDRGLAVLFGR